MEDDTIYQYYMLSLDDTEGVDTLKGTFNEHLMSIEYKMYRSEDEKELTLGIMKGLRKQIENY